MQTSYAMIFILNSCSRNCKELSFFCFFFYLCFLKREDWMKYWTIWENTFSKVILFYMWVILVKIVRFVPYATLWKHPLASSGIVIKCLVQLKFICYHRSGKKNIYLMYVNLQLSVNENFSAYGTMVKILATMTCWRYESFKKQVSHTQHIFSVVYGTLNF